MDVYLSEKARPKEWFPDHIPGLFKLSKGEAMDDIDFITCNLMYTSTSNERSSRHKRRKEADTAPKAKSVGETSPVRGSPSKRARLVEKTNNQRTTLAGLKSSHQALRHSLESVRSEIVQYRDAVVQTKREIRSALEEREGMENHFRSLREDYQADISRSEQNRVNYEKEMTFLKERLSTKNTQVAEVMQRAAELHELHGALEAKDNQIAELQEKVRSSMRVGQMLQKAQQQAEEFAAFPQGAALNAAPTGALKPAVLDFISRYTKHAEELEKQVREANLKATQATDALKLQEPKLASLAHQLEEKHLKIKELEVKVASLEKCRKEEKKQSEDLAKSMEESQKDYADLHKKNEGLAEQIQLLKELLEVAETRANVADNNTRSQIEEIHILRAGNKIIQGAYNTLIAEHLEKNPEAGLRIAWAGMETVEEMRQYHLKRADEIVGELKTEGCKMTLEDALQLNNKQIEEEKIALEEELAAAREAEMQSSNQISQLEAAAEKSKQELEDLKSELEELKRAQALPVAEDETLDVDMGEAGDAVSSKLESGAAEQQQEEMSDSLQEAPTEEKSVVKTEPSEATGAEDQVDQEDPAAGQTTQSSAAEQEGAEGAAPAATAAEDGSVASADQVGATEVEAPMETATELQA